MKLNCLGFFIIIGSILSPAAFAEGSGITNEIGGTGRSMDDEIGGTNGTKSYEQEKGEVPRKKDSRSKAGRHGYGMSYGYSDKASRESSGRDNEDLYDRSGNDGTGPKL